MVKTQRKPQEENQYLLPTRLSFPSHWPCKWGQKVKGKQGNEPMERHGDQDPGRHRKK